MYQTKSTEGIIAYTTPAWDYKNAPVLFLSPNNQTKRNRRTPTDPTAPQMLTIRELAEKTGISESHIRKLCKTKAITYIKAGVKYLINYDRFIDYLNGTL